MGNAHFKHAKITGVKLVLPKRKISIDDEVCYYDGDVKRVQRMKAFIGLGDRYVVDPGVTCLDLSHAAAERLIAEMRIDPETIDGIIVASNCHDFSGPADACIEQGRLGLKDSATCLDLNGLSCSSYVHALLIAHSFIENGVMKRCLVLSGDMNSTHSDVRNRNSNMLYSDAGSATIVERTEDETPSWFNTGTHGKGWDRIIAPASGYKVPIRKDIAGIEVTDSKGNVWHLWDEILKGFDIFQFTMYAAPASIKTLFEYSGLSAEDIDYFPMHQANGQIVGTIARRAGVPKTKTSGSTFSKYANCGAPSVVSAICDQLFGKDVSRVMLVTFGVGLSWGSCIVDLKGLHNGGVEFYHTPEDLPTREETIKKWINHFMENDNGNEE